MRLPWPVDSKPTETQSAFKGRSRNAPMVTTGQQNLSFLWHRSMVSVGNRRVELEFNYMGPGTFF